MSVQSGRKALCVDMLLGNIWTKNIKKPFETFKFHSFFAGFDSGSLGRAEATVELGNGSNQGACNKQATAHWRNLI